MPDQSFLSDYPRLQAIWLWAMSHPYFSGGLVGGFVAAMLVRDTIARRVALFFLTPLAVVYIGPFAHDVATDGIQRSGSREAAGFAIGLFIIVLLRIAFAGFERVQVGHALQAVVDRLANWAGANARARATRGKARATPRSAKHDDPEH